MEGTETSPHILFDADQGLFQMSGRSHPEDYHSFFAPLIEIIEEYVKKPQKKTLMNIYMEYINTGSSKYFIKLLIAMKSVVNEGYEIEINWLYDESDDSMLEIARDFETVLKVPFNFIEVEE